MVEIIGVPPAAVGDGDPDVPAPPWEGELSPKVTEGEA